MFVCESVLYCCETKPMVAPYFNVALLIAMLSC